MDQKRIEVLEKQLANIKQALLVIYRSGPWNQLPWGPKLILRQVIEKEADEWDAAKMLPLDKRPKERSEGPAPIIDGLTLTADQSPGE